MPILSIIILIIFALGIMVLPADQAISINFMNTDLGISLRLFMLFVSLFILILIFITWIIFKIVNLPRHFIRNKRFKSEKSDLISILEGFEAQEVDDYKKLAKLCIYLTKNKHNTTFIQFQHLINILEYRLATNINYKDKFRAVDDILLDLTMDERTVLFALKHLITIRMVANCFHDALIYAEKAYQHNAKLDWVLFNLIEAYTKTNQFEKAEKMIYKAYSEDILDINSKNGYLAKLFMLQGNYFQSNFDVPKAIKAYEKLLKIEPNNIEALDYMLKKLIKNKELRQVSKLVKDAWIAKNNFEVGRIIFKNNDLTFEFKENLFKDLTKIDEQDKLANIFLAELYIQNSKYEHAKIISDKILSLHEPDSKISKLMAILELKTSTSSKNDILYWVERI